MAWLAQNVPNYAELSQRDKASANARARYNTDSAYRERVLAHMRLQNKLTAEKRRQKREQNLEGLMQQHLDKIAELPEPVIEVRPLCAGCGLFGVPLGLQECDTCRTRKKYRKELVT